MTEHARHRLDLAAADVTWSGRPDAKVLARRVGARGWWYCAEHELTSQRAWLLSIVLAAIGNPLVYLLAMGLGLSSIINANAGQVDGVSYLTFVAPALLVSTIVMSASAEFSFPVLGGFTWNRRFFGAQASPLRPRDLPLGLVVASMVRFVWQATIFYLMMLLFGAAPGAWGWLTIVVGVLAAASFGAPMMAFAATRESGMDASFALINRFIIMPMFLFAGTFFPLDVMPVYLRWIGWVSPVWHATELSRVVSYGSSPPPWLIAAHSAFLLVTAALGLWAAVRVFERRLTS